MSNRKENLERILRLAEESDATATYSSIMRDLNKDGDTEKRTAFMKSFKESFDKAMSQSLDDAQGVALLEAQQEVDA
jgi:hypothetical protein